MMQSPQLPGIGGLFLLLKEDATHPIDPAPVSSLGEPRSRSPHGVLGRRLR